ncbi:MAG TPA: DUF4147 domain-containing protein [Candidatus Syntrophosphaera sp.]|nr:DUF4147 domain-containing protein [Candidatus Syntrophosphaera sp.]
MSSLHHLVYQSYYQLMHEFCQYPQLLRHLKEDKIGDRVKLLAIGKAAWKMASLGSAQLADRGIGCEGFVLTKYGLSLGEIPGLKILEAGHPLPDANSLKHSRQIVDWLRSLSAQDELLVLLSGGTSALFELLPPGSNLTDQESAHKQLLQSGKNIAEINRERAALSLVKGGNALDHINAKRIHIYAVSDVAENDPRVLGSGPFTPCIDGEKTVSGWKYKLPGKQITYKIVADNNAFLSQLASDLRSQGFRVYLEEEFQSCSLPAMAERIKEVLRKAHLPRFRLRPPFLYLWGGETPLKVGGPGQGGRCSHLALSLVPAVAKYPDTALFCFATDGNDNVRGSGGAFVDSQTKSDLLKANISLANARKDCDSYAALQAIHHILPSPLLATNVNDIFLLSAGYNLENPFNGNAKDEIDLFDSLL